MIWCTIGDFFHPIPPKKGNCTLSFNATHYSLFFHMAKSLISASTAIPLSCFKSQKYRIASIILFVIISSTLKLSGE